MPQQKSALRARIAASAPLDVSFTDESGAFTKVYRVAFNLNVLATIAEKTGLSGLGFDVWTHLDARVLRAMLWAALLPNHPEFDTRDRSGNKTDEGLETVGSWMAGEGQEKFELALWEAYLAYLPKAQADALRTERERLESAAGAGGAGPLAPKHPVNPPANSDSSSSGPSADSTSGSPKAISAS